MPEQQEQSEEVKPSRVAKQYDCIAIRDKQVSDDQTAAVLALLRPFTDVERKMARRTFGIMKHEVTRFRCQADAGWWPKMTENIDGEEHPAHMCGKIVARAYAKAPEFLPTDFLWERVEIEGIEYAVGGTLKNAAKRT